MKDSIYEVSENNMIAKATYLMKLKGDMSEITKPGSFIAIKLDGHYLRRPMSISKADSGEISVVYKVVGKGTEFMRNIEPGEELKCLAPLGNGFDLGDVPSAPTLIAGGTGTMPIYFLAKTLINLGKEPKVILGFNDSDEVFYKEEFEELGADVTFCTMDGSLGFAGTAVDAMSEGDYVCCCGPEPMLRAAYEKSSGGQFDLEARMACGFGACMGCTIETAKGPRRVCTDGPIFKKEELLWRL